MIDGPGIIIHANRVLMLNALEIESRRAAPILRNTLPSVVHRSEITTGRPVPCKDGFLEEGFRYLVSFPLGQLGELTRTVVVTLTDQGLRASNARLC